MDTTNNTSMSSAVTYSQMRYVTRSEKIIVETRGQIFSRAKKKNPCRVYFSIPRKCVASALIIIKDRVTYLM